MALPAVVLAAFHRAGVPVPDQARVDRVGYSAQERRIIDREIALRRN